MCRVSQDKNYLNAGIKRQEEKKETEICHGQLVSGL